MYWMKKHILYFKYYIEVLDNVNKIAEQLRTISLEYDCSPGFVCCIFNTLLQFTKMETSQRKSSCVLEVEREFDIY